MPIRVSRSPLSSFPTYVLALVALAGCTSTKLIEAWRSNNPELSGYSKLLVVGMAENPDTRRIFEDDFAAAAGRKGFTAVPSYLQIPETGKVARDKVEEAARAASCDAVLTTRLVKADRQYVTASRTRSSALGAPYNYDDAWERHYEPPQVYELVTVTLQVDLYDAKSGELAWSGRTRTVDPRRLSAEVAAWSEEITKALIGAGMVRGTVASR